MKTIRLINNCIAFIMVAILSTALNAEESNTFLTVNEQELHYKLTGDGDFTIVFESGFGSNLTHWQKIVSSLGHKAKVLTYTRPGFGLSKLNGKARSLKQSIEDLQGLLTGLKLQPPFLLVGHSYGALISRGFVQIHPELVAGMVLVDPMNPGIIKALRKLDARATDTFLEAYDKMVPPKFKEANAELDKIYASGSMPYFGPTPKAPVAILTSMKQEYPQFIIHSKEGKDLWRKQHRELFSTYQSGVHFITSTSGHNIAKEQPELVLDAINMIMKMSNLQQ